MLNEETRLKAFEKTLFTDKEASEFLRISQVTLWRERRRGRITFRRVASKIVYLRKDLDEYLNSNVRPAKIGGTK